MIPVAQSFRSPTEHFLQISRAKLLDDFLPRLEKAVSVIPAEMFWEADGPSTNSPGNILLHMSGNLRQWIIAGIGGGPDERQRDAEFSASGIAEKPELLERLRATIHEACEVLSSVQEESLAMKRRIQTYDITGYEAIYHAVEHFSYHLGQVIHIAKRLSGENLRLYPF